MNEADKKRRKLLANKNRASQYLVAKPINQTAVKNGNNKKESRESKKIRDSNTTTLMLIVVITVRHNLTTVILIRCVRFNLFQKCEESLHFLIKYSTSEV